MRSALAIGVLLYMFGCEFALLTIAVRSSFLNAYPTPRMECFDDLVHHIGRWAIYLVTRVFGWPYYLTRFVRGLVHRIATRNTT